jgi:hypothetical protein
LGDGGTLLKSDTVWKKLVLDAKQRGCFYDANEDKNLAQAITAAFVEQYVSANMYMLFSLNLTLNPMNAKVCYQVVFMP